MKKSYTGINIQWPISQDILSGQKTIETRTYPIPEKHLNKELLLIETPGKKGKFKARIVGIIKFTNCFQYTSRSNFYSDIDRHLVDKNSPWAWGDKPKWGWEVKVIKKLDNLILNKRKGIVFTNDITI